MLAAAQNSPGAMQHHVASHGRCHLFVHISRETPDVTPCHTSPPQVGLLRVRCMYESRVPGQQPVLRWPRVRRLQGFHQGRSLRKGTDGVSTNGVTENAMFFGGGTFWVLPLIYVIFPKVPGRTFFPNLSNFIICCHFCSDPISVDPISPQPKPCPGYQLWQALQSGMFSLLIRLYFDVFVVLFSPPECCIVYLI